MVELLHAVSIMQQLACPCQDSRNTLTPKKINIKNVSCTEKEQLSGLVEIPILTQLKFQLDTQLLFQLD
jgi:hypothetical protein